jgi:hypothetical protein
MGEYYIEKLHKGRVVDFAASELQRYLALLSEENKAVTDPGSRRDVIELGTFYDLGMNTSDNDGYEDEIYVKTEGCRGIIAGSNQRSVLLAVYRFLTELGCRWVGPGIEGEVVPHIDIDNIKIAVREKPSYKFRGVCIEGAVSYDDVKNMIDWMPKLGMNTYFIQFREAYTFFQRWYDHIGNPLYENKERFSIEKAREYVERISEEITKRGLIYQATGHGWTCEPFGIPGISWEVWKEEIDEQTSKYFALVNNKRELWGGVPLNTNICFSNPKARSMIIEDICRYSLSHPDVDIIHFWLSDGANNHCECSRCIDIRPSDAYVQMLNELSDVMNERGIKTKIVFLIYQDLLWPPVTQKIKDPDRFIILFAPITRTYRSSFKTDKELPEIPAYVRNRIQLPRSVEGNMAFLRKWQEIFHGDGMDFDYHFMWAHHKDPGYMRITRVLHEDILNLRSMGLDGYISCQVQRSTFPNGFGIYVMGKTLWNRDLAFDEIAGDYYKSTYGENSDKVFSYLDKLSELYFSLDLEQKPELSSEKAEICDKIEAHIYENLKPGNLEGLLIEHASIWLEITASLRCIYSGDVESAKTKWEDVKKLLWEKEPKLRDYFDTFNFVRTFNGLFR